MRYIYDGLAIAAVVVLAGCTNPGIVRISPDTYMLAREAHGGIFASAASMKADVIQEASDFASKQGKVAVPISVKEKPLGSGPAQWATIEYQFRVVDKDDAAVRPTQLIHDPNILIQKADPDTPNKALMKQSLDTYNNLLKLDELRKRGVITDTEFNDEKKKLLQTAK